MKKISFGRAKIPVRHKLTASGLCSIDYGIQTESRPLDHTIELIGTVPRGRQFRGESQRAPPPAALASGG